VLWQILAQFIFRLCFGLAACMACTSPRQVIGSFYRVHLWVLLGLGTFGCLVVFTRPELFSRPQWLLGLAITGTVLCYLGSVIWLYDARLAGMGSLLIISILFFLASVAAFPDAMLTGPADWGWLVADVTSSSLLLGSTFAAMLLGHWYLNSPSMKLDPLKRLLLILAVSLGARAVICGYGLVLHASAGDVSDAFSMAAVCLRWFGGLAGLAAMTWMTWQTLKIPNTQSATGILYVALVFVFLGELASALLSQTSPIPL
jgi:hypothetical protein